ncbi:hypothetical protein EG328_010974 [Venturia inaequalis]|uniref:Uncharacterized protein n=1 Tax=Venturia inaequalis TaxID=5025 RepID=A0A8H3Z1Z6_VENIN|nr:hypothetical protein EG328_010974 [Venturia inaequalis]
MRFTAALAIAALSSSALAYPAQASVDTTLSANHDEPPVKPGTDPKLDPKTAKPKTKLKIYEFPEKCKVDDDWDWTKPVLLPHACKLPKGFHFPAFDAEKQKLEKTIKNEKGEKEKKKFTFEWPKECELPKEADWKKGVAIPHECELPKGFLIPKALVPVVPGVKQEKPKEEKPKTEKPKEEKPKETKPKEEKPKTEKPKEEKPKETKPKTEKPKGEKPNGEPPKGTDADPNEK